MANKAHRIPAESWQRHKEEIIALYLAPQSTLDQTMQHMRDRYGFQPSKNQYITRLKAWGIAKNATGQIWEYIDKKRRQRKLEEKDSDVVVHGRKRTRLEVDKEIARHVPSLRQCGTITADIPTPDGVDVHTPQDHLAHSHRLICIDNLPWLRFKQEAQLLTQHILGCLFPRYDPAGSETNITAAGNSSLYLAHGASSLSADTNAEVDSSVDLNQDKVADASLSRAPKHPPFCGIGCDTQSACFPPDLVDPIMTLSSAASRDWDDPSAVKRFIHSFVFQVANNLLDRVLINKRFDWIATKVDLETLATLSMGETPYMRVFTREIFHSAVRLGNTRLVSKLIEDGAGASLEVGYMEATHDVTQLWNPATLRTLSTLLSHGADPENLVAGQGCGFPLINAALQGSLEAVNLLLHHGAKVNRYLPRYYGSALQAATANGHLTLVEHLIQCGANVNMPCGIPYQGAWRKYQRGTYYTQVLQTPIQIAAQNNNMRIVEVLMQNGASPSACRVAADTLHLFHKEDLRRILTKYSVATPIQYATWNQNFGLVCLLLSAGVDPDSILAPSYASTPLQVSARSGNLPITKLLLQEGADVNAPPPICVGRTAIQAAAESGSLDVARLLIQKGADLNAPAGTDRGMTTLQAAASRGRGEMVDFLLDRRADVNAAPAGQGGLTALQAAVSHKDLSIVQNLVRHGAEVNAPASNCGDTAIQVAARNGWTEGAEYLLSQGAAINDAAPPGSSLDVTTLTALGCSISKRDKNMLKLLLNHGADVLAPVSGEDEPLSALLFALEKEADCEIIGWLLEREPGLITHITGEHTITLSTTGLVQDFESIRMINSKTITLPTSSKDCQIRDAWHALPSEDDWVYSDSDIKGFIAVLLKAGADINSKHPVAKNTSLQRALCYCYNETAQFLIFEGAEVNCPPTFTTGTPLQEAFKYDDEDVHPGSAELANILLDRGADVNAPPAVRRGVTALQVAAMRGLIQVAIRLLECGARVAAAAAPIDGRTAIDGAAEHGRLDMLQLLLNAYDGQEDLSDVCESAAEYAEAEGHDEIVQWLMEYPFTRP